MYYSVQSKASTYKKGIICIICGIIIGIITVFIQLLLNGIIVLTDEQLITCVSLFAGLLTDAIILCITIPKFHLALHSTKITGSIINIEEYDATYKTSSGFLRHTTIYTPIVEYTIEGEKFSGIKLNTTTSKKPEIGAPISLRISDSNHKDIIDKKQLVFLIFATILFLLMGALFSLPGIIYLANGNFNNFTVSTATSTGNSEEYGNISLLIGGGFALFWIILGLILCIKANHKNRKKALTETGIKKACIITYVNVNTNTIINGKNPVKITCKSDDGTLFYAKTTDYPETYSENQAIDVYINPDNPEKYYVDFDSVDLT